MRILFSCGNAPGLPTGYGGQCLLALRAFCAAGARVTILAWNLTPPQFTPFREYTTEDVVRIAPHMAKALDAEGAADVPWGAVTWFGNPYTQFPAPIHKRDLNRMIARVDADLFVSLQDIFMFQPGAFLCLSAVWMPLHFLPVEHPTVLSLADFDMQLPISGWGALLLEQLHGDRHGAETLRHIEVVPHGRSNKVFRPLHDAALRASTRAAWNWPEDAFVCLLIASNSEESGRKALDAQLQAFAEFARREPRAFLHIHSEVARAYDIGRLLETFGLWSGRAAWNDPSDPRMRTAREAVIRGPHVAVSHASHLLNVSESQLCELYNAADVLLAATCSEGCGVPILEAQLCGCPVVTTAATAMWEETMLGIAVPPRQWIARMDFNSGWYLPDANGITNALSTIASWTPEDRRAHVARCLPRVVAAYENAVVETRWREILAKVDAALASGFTSPKLLLGPARRAMLQVATRARHAWHRLETEADGVRDRVDAVKRMETEEGVVAILNQTTP